MITFTKHGIVFGYWDILQMYLFALKLTNKIEWSWLVVFLPYIILGGSILIMSAIGAILEYKEEK